MVTVIALFRLPCLVSIHATMPGCPFPIGMRYFAMFSFEYVSNRFKRQIMNANSRLLFLSPSKQRDQIIMPSERVSTLDFVNTQLSFIAQAWSQAEATSTDESLQQVSLQDFRLVDGVAPGGWCDGSATSPLWQQTLGPAGLPNEATFPVTCTRHGLKHPNRVYSLRVGINRQRGQDDAEQAYARFKTDYRVLERLTPHPNVLQVLAHFRNSIAQAFGEDTSKEQPNVSHAIFVITNHLPLLNTRMYLRKCEVREGVPFQRHFCEVRILSVKQTYPKEEALCLVFQ